MSNDISAVMPVRVMDSARSDLVSKVQGAQAPQPNGSGRPPQAADAAQGVQAIDEVVSGLNETDEVVRQIPSEEIVRLHRQMKEVAGVLFRSAV